MTAPALTMTGVTKRFGPTLALEDVDFAVAAGEVRALVGENGAGKSTLVRILAGAVRPDAGRLTLAGRPYRPRSPRDARRAGVAMIHQELSLAPPLTAAENVFLGLEPCRGLALDRRRLTAAARRALARLGADLDPRTPVGRLPRGARQLVEVARALVVAAPVVVLDEPTGSLAAPEAERLFGAVRQLAAEGRAVVYISHFLEEVQRVADTFTVLRDGRVAATGRVRDVRPEDLVAHMVGRHLGRFYPPRDRRPGEAVLTVAGIAGREDEPGVDLTLHQGEILGLAGLVGAGRTEFLRRVYGLARAGRGVVRLHGSGPEPAPPWRRIRQGMGFLSASRGGEGLALRLSIADNLTLSRLAPYRGRLGLRLGARRRAVAAWLTRLGVRAADPDQPVGELSGGNRQKVLLGRLLHQGAEVLLLDEPTRGIDVASKADFYRRIDRLARGGAAVLLASSHLPELLGLCDRIAVFHRGRVVALRPAAAWTEGELLLAATLGRAA